MYRSLVFVPANNERFVAKAASLDADIICLDLEDSVPDAEKPRARRLAASALSAPRSAGSRMFVRTCAPQGAGLRADLAAVVRAGLDGLVVPKVDSAAQVRAIASRLLPLERSRRLARVEILPSVESARAVASCAQIAAAPRVRAVVFGIFDLMHDMRTDGADAARLARGLVPLYARAGGAEAIDSIWQRPSDLRGLLRDCREGRRMGYSGKSLIHPGQIRTAHRAFAPTGAEAERARRVRDAYEAASRRARGAALVDGKMIDAVHYKQALDVLAAAKPRR